MTVGSVVTCIYVGIFSWTPSGDEYVKNVPVECTVVQKSEEFQDLAAGYHHLQVNCTEGKKKWNLVPNHKLNHDVYWTSTDECHDFSEARLKAAHEAQKEQERLAKEEYEQSLMGKIEAFIKPILDSEDPNMRKVGH